MSASRTPIKKTLRRIAIFAVIVLVLYLFLPKLIDVEKTIAMLSGASYVLLAIAICFEALALLSYANLFRFVLSILDIRLRLREVLGITMSSFAVSHFLSAGGVGGWIVTYSALRKRNVPHGLIFVAIAAQQFFNYIVLWIVFACALVYLVVERQQSIGGYLLGLILIGLLLGLTLYAIYLYNHKTQMRRRASQIAALVNKLFRREVVKNSHIDAWLDNLFAGMRRITSRRGSYGKAALRACGFWLSDMICFFVVFLAFDYKISIGALAVSYVVAYTIGTLAPTPGGLGAVEGILIALTVSFGVPSATAVTVVLAYRLINFWLPIPPGLLAYAIVRPRDRKIPESELTPKTRR